MTRMRIKKGCCRIELKSGLVEFGRVTEINDTVVRFHGYNPISIGRNIPIGNIVHFESYEEDDIPPYE